MNQLSEALNFKAAGIEAEPQEDQYLSRFGSHFSLRFHPAGRGVLPVGLGPINADECVYLGVEIDDVAWALPLQYPQVFCRDERGILEFDLSRTMTSVTLESRADHPGIGIEWTFVSPFWPGDERLSTAPLFSIAGQVVNRGAVDRRVVVRAGLEKPCRPLATGHGIGLIRRIEVAAAFRGPETKPGRLLRYDLGIASADPAIRQRAHETSVAYWECLEREQVLAPGERMSCSFVLAEFLAEDHIVVRHGIPCRFAYQGSFASLETVIDYGLREHRSIGVRCTRFDALVAETTLPARLRDFICWNFHIFLGATWLLEQPDGRRFYTCYEGGTGYFSTVDVEYNLAPFYAFFWPRLLADQLDLWADTYRRGNRRRPHAAGPSARIMPHDVGGGFAIDEQVYIQGPMPVEENANYLLIEWLYHRFTGDTGRFRDHEDTCRQLADAILDSDVNGNGLPDVETSNTLDCFEPLMRDCGDQVYLGLKAGAALAAMDDLLAVVDHGGNERYRDRAAAIFAAVERDGWLGDHYVITISPSRPKEGDGGTPLTVNGLVYLLLGGRPVPLNARRLGDDLRKLADDYTIWPSMGVWRDIAGCYLGLEPRGSYRFRPDFRGDMYPRSFTAIAFLLAWPGIGIDVPAATIRVSNPRDGRYPLLPYADWDAGTIPWLVLRGGIASLEGDCRAALRIEMRPRET